MIPAADRAILNRLQDGLPVSERPFRDVAHELGLGEDELIARLRTLLDDGVLTRFGPMYNAERLGGVFVLAAMEVPEDRFDEVAEIVNAFPEVAHNYARAHGLNMWFVVATDHPGRADEVMAGIEARTGLAVYAMPKLEEYFVGLRFET